MPPKVRIKKEQIFDAACELVREEGIAGLNARALAKKAGCSTQPIFTTYASMEEVLEEVRQYGENLFASYVRRYEKEENPLYRYGSAYLVFATDERHLFEMLYRDRAVNPVYETFTGNKSVLAWVSEDTGLDERYAAALCKQFFYYIHGIACAAGQGLYSGEAEGDCRPVMKDFYKAYRKLYRKKSE